MAWGARCEASAREGHARCERCRRAGVYTTEGTARAPCPRAGGCLARCHESVGGCIRRRTMREGRTTMDDEQHQQPSEESRGESALLKLQEEFHHFIHECHECRREIASHWQFCAHCGTRLATHCPGCG